jgi:Mg-chelatase subunit ChlD
MALFTRFTQRFLSQPSPRKPQNPSPRPAPTRPQPPHQVSYRPAAAYVLVVDESGSTGTAFRQAGNRTTSRMAAIQQAAHGYLRQLLAANPRQLVAVVGFSETATLYHPLAPVGPGFGSLSRALGALQPHTTTNLSAGLSLGLSQLARAGAAHSHLVVITDGDANRAQAQLPDLIRQAQVQRVRIFTIGIGNNTDGDYDRVLLFNMARSTGGRFASAHTFTALQQALSRVA